MMPVFIFSSLTPEQRGDLNVRVATTHQSVKLIKERRLHHNSTLCARNTFMPRRGRTVATTARAVSATLLLIAILVVWHIFVADGATEVADLGTTDRGGAGAMDPFETEKPDHPPSSSAIRHSSAKEATNVNSDDPKSDPPIDDQLRHSESAESESNESREHQTVESVDANGDRANTLSIERLNQSDQEAELVKPVEEEQPSPTTLTEEHHPHPKRNYASKECGAKVLYSNEEAENRGAILNDPERDDYMRNPCEKAKNKFLIIELCETIQPTSLEIANFELFSSSPRNFRLWGSERYPTQEWALIGEFEAHDNREVQPFQVLERASYAKFVKLELLTHYGKEHFCTLSTLRLYGTSMVDEYEAEAASASSSSTTQLPPIADEQIIPIQPIEIDQSAEHQRSIMDQQREGKPSKMTIEGNNNKDPFFEDYENNTEAPAECNLDAPELNVTNTSTGEKALDASPRESNGGDEKGGQSKEPTTNFVIVSPDEATKQEGKKEGQPPDASNSDNMLKTIVVDVFGNIKQAFGFASKQHGNERNNTISEEELRYQNNLVHLCNSCARDSSLRSQCNWLCHTFFTRHRPQNRASLTKQQRSLAEFLNRISPNRSAFCPALAPVAQTCLRNGAGKTKNNAQTQQPHRVEQQQQQQKLPSNVNINDEKPPKQQQQQAAPIQQQQQQKPLTNGKVDEKGNLRPLPGTSSSHKESVFMKLNKRLAALEQNMSLSSEHLLELSKRCASGGARADDAKQQQERFVREAERLAKQEALRVEEDMKQRISELQREVRRLSQQLQSVQTTVVQATGSGGFFYRPMLTPVHGYSASDGESQCREHACLNGGVSTVPPLHTTSASPYGSMPIAAHSPFEAKTSDGLWTTSQVIYLMILVQLGTLVLIKIFRALCDQLTKNNGPTSINPAQLLGS